jgi:hypothetical protein
MKYWALIPLLFILSAFSAEGTRNPFSGSDAYSQELSYPVYSNPFSPASLVAGNNTSALSPVLLGATVFSPEFRFINPNSTGYYHPILPVWDQFTFYLPFTSMQDWFSGSYDGQVSAVKDIMREDWKPAAQGYDTPAVRQFMQEDSYREGVEPHNDPDRMGLNHFLDDDEPPRRPLL